MSANSVPDNATQIRVTVHRALGGDVVKLSKTTGSVLNGLKTATQTAPVVIQAGTYNETASGSWTAPAAVWTAETMPTSVTVDLLAIDQVIATTTSEIDSFDGVTGADVMPVAANLVSTLTEFRNSEQYKGVAVNFTATGITDAESVTVTVKRETGGDVVKVNKPGASFLASMRTGVATAVTVPIVIQPGATYNESASSSWVKPVAVWTPTSVPTEVTVVIKRTIGPDASFTVPISDARASITDVMPEATPPLIIDVPTDLPVFEVDVPADAEEPALNLGTPDSAGAVTLPVAVEISTQVGASLSIPADTTITSTDPAWDGVLGLPQVVTDVTVPAPSGVITEVSLAIELGTPGHRIEFSTPVKLVLAGQAGMNAGYIEGGVFHAITEECPVAGAAAMVGGECWNIEGDDLVIWTTHFTTFVAYSAVGTDAGITVTPPASDGKTPVLAATGAAAFGPLLTLMLVFFGLGGAVIGAAGLRRKFASER